MPSLDRTLQPNFNVVNNINIIKAKKHLLSNNIPVYTINAGSQDIVRIEIVFEAGSWYQESKLIATSVNSMLNTGTKKLSEMQIAEQLDYYGAYLDLDSDRYTSTIYLYTLNKYLEGTIKIVAEIIKNSVFPKKEFDIYLQNRKQQFIVDNSKVDQIARNKFNKLLFGEKHPYGQTVKLSDFDNLKVNMLPEFYKKYYNAQNCKIIASGIIKDDFVELMDKNFGSKTWLSTKIDSDTKNYKIITTANTKNFILKEDAVQSAIRVGKLMVNKTHPDYMGMFILNTILGGYFGSRLMKNIREDKGYTYSIGSGLVSLKDTGYLVIMSEVGTDVCSKALDEIYYEIDKLKNELISDEELKLVKNFTLSDILRAFDGPFALAESFRSLLEYNLDYDYFDRFINTVKTITPIELNNLAKKYFTEDSFIEVVAGNKSK